MDPSNDISRRLHEAILEAGFDCLGRGLSIDDVAALSKDNKLGTEAPVDKEALKAQALSPEDFIVGGIAQTRSYIIISEPQGQSYDVYYGYPCHGNTLWEDLSQYVARTPKDIEQERRRKINRLLPPLDAKDFFNGKQGLLRALESCGFVHEAGPFDYTEAYNYIESRRQKAEPAPYAKHASGIYHVAWDTSEVFSGEAPKDAYLLLKLEPPYGLKKGKKFVFFSVPNVDAWGELSKKLARRVHAAEYGVHEENEENELEETKAAHDTSETIPLDATERGLLEEALGWLDGLDGLAPRDIEEREAQAAKFGKWLAWSASGASAVYDALAARLDRAADSTTALTPTQTRSDQDE